MYVLAFLFIMAIFSTSVMTILNIDIFKYLMLFFFLAGAYVSINSLPLRLNIKSSIVYIMMISWVVLEFLLLYFEVNFIGKSWVTKLITNLLIILGCLSCWSLYDILDDKYDFKYRKVYTYGFFIYATHGIPIIFFKKFVISKMGLTGYQLYFFYLFTFALITTLCIMLGVFTKKFLPKFYNFTTGNR